MKTSTLTRTLALPFSLLAFSLLVLPCGACPSGKCGGISGGTGTFKGSPSKLPVITATNGNSISVGKKEFLIDGNATIVVNGSKADAAAIQPGMRVLLTSTLIDREKNLYKATRITARTPEDTK